MKPLVRILPLLLLTVAVAALLTGCGVKHYYITIINETPWDVCVDPYGYFLYPGDRVDTEVDYFEVVHVVAFRCSDSVLLAHADMIHGDVLIIEWP